MMTISRLSLPFPPEESMAWCTLPPIRTTTNDDQRRWVTDPLQIHDGLNTPFGFYGLTPALFDAPARSDRTTPLDWCAESFLCFAPSAPMAREVYPAVGFSWGFVLDGDQIAPTEPEALPQSAWTKHLGLLRSSYSNWSFLALPNGAVPSD